jgi:hypothetical protein
MKKLFYLLPLCFAMGYGQNASSAQDPSASELAEQFNKLLNESDFTMTDGRMLVDEFPCKISNASATDQVLVSVICKVQAFKEFGLTKINDLILLANDKSRNTVSGGIGYRPTEIKMSYNPEAKAWSMTNLFSVEDENGVIKKSLLSLDFDSTGKFLAMKRVF